MPSIEQTCEDRSKGGRMPSPFATRLIATASDLHTRFHTMVETDPPLTDQIRQFWTALGLTFPGVSTAWSAVFVSFCVKQAGATTAEFKFNPFHSVFVNAAIKNALNNTGVFRGRRLAEHAPAIGDIIQNNRNGNRFDFEFARTHLEYSSHSAIVVDFGSDANGRFAVTVGGNESNSIRRSLVRLDNAGLVKQRSADPYICVVEDLK
jgi:hypothetical protein